MTSELITDIGELSTFADQEGRRANAALVIDNGRIAWIGRSVTIV